MTSLLKFIKSELDGDLLPWSAYSKAAEQFGSSYAEIEKLALENSFLPARYQRNRNMISTSEQLLLFRSRVAVIGCGGLGGYIIEELARLGVGEIVAVDPDIFEEHNLNRQLLSTHRNLGQSKAAAAAARVYDINPAVTVTAIKAVFCKSNGNRLLTGVTVAVDAMDSIAYRLELAEVCTDMQIPIVHGAIGGWYGQITTQLPSDTTIQKIYQNRQKGTGIEKELGNPAFTPAVIASLQVAETCKILLGRGELLQNRQLNIDLLDMEINEVHF